MKVTEKTYKKLVRLTRAALTEDGREVNNPRPVAMPAGFDRPPTLQEQIKRVLQTEAFQQAQEQGFESFEESQDFAVEDEFDLPEISSAYELMMDEVPLEKPKEEKEVTTDASSSDNTNTESGVEDGAPESPSGSGGQVGQPS